MLRTLLGSSTNERNIDATQPNNVTHFVGWLSERGDRSGLHRPNTGLLSSLLQL
jgi:hypothetical protein